MRIVSLLVLLPLLLASCYRQPAPRSYYGEGYNFVVMGDSLPLQTEDPLLAVDSIQQLSLPHGTEIVVVTRQFIASDSIDSVWVRVAHDQYTMGWTHERDLLGAVAPNDPISLFIYAFSNRHLIYFLGTVALVVLLVLVRRSMRQSIRIVHLDDIPSPYPTLLCIAIASSAVLYASIQHFAPSVWQQFYFAPTLNPFGLDTLPCAFICCVWLMVVLSLATLDDVFRLLPPGQAVVYLFNTLGVSMGLYTVFSIAPLVYVAIPCLALYALWAVMRYIRHSRPTCLCGQCGRPLHSPNDICAWCGTQNEQANT